MNGKFTIEHHTKVVDGVETENFHVLRAVDHDGSHRMFSSIRTDEGELTQLYNLIREKIIDKKPV